MVPRRKTHVSQNQPNHRGYRWMPAKNNLRRRNRRGNQSPDGVANSDNVCAGKVFLVAFGWQSLQALTRDPEFPKSDSHLVRPGWDFETTFRAHRGLSTFQDKNKES